MCFLFGNLINSINDIDPIVSQKSITMIETLGEQAAKSILACLELQFDSVIQDRPLILKIVSKFYSCFANSAKNQPILTWEFFMSRFNILFIEQQLSQESASPVDISGQANNSNNFQRRVTIAKFALKRSDFVKSITNDINNIQLSFINLNDRLSNGNRDDFKILFF